MTRTRFPEKLWKTINGQQNLLDPSIQWNEEGSCFIILDEMKLVRALQASDITLTCTSSFII
jgi:hypothetical protein